MKIINKIEENLIAVGLLISVLLVFANVILRYIFNNNTTWVEEAVRFMIIWITFIGSAACFRRSSHMGIDLIFTFAKGPFKKVVKAFILLVSLLCMVFLFKYGIDLVLFTKKTGQITPALEIKTFWVYIGIPLGAFLSGIEIIQLLIKTFKTKE